MKLSEAIRLGSLLRPQGFGALENKGRTCAMGAAREAVGLPMDCQVVTPWAWTYALFEGKCPVCNEGDRDSGIVYIIASHLNDEHRWPRERIADWVASVEPQEEHADGGPGPVAASLEVQAV